MDGSHGCITVNSLLLLAVQSVLQCVLVAASVCSHKVFRTGQ